jgi:hypothetical protein
MEMWYEEAVCGLKKKLKNPVSESIFFLYRDLFKKKIHNHIKNSLKISEYQKTLEHSY